MKPKSIGERVELHREFGIFIRDNKPLMYNEENNNKVPISALRIMKESLGGVR